MRIPYRKSNKRGFLLVLINRFRMFRESKLGVIVCYLRDFLFDVTDPLLLGVLILNEHETVTSWASNVLPQTKVAV